MTGEGPKKPDQDIEVTPTDSKAGEEVLDLGSVSPEVGVGVSESEIKDAVEIFWAAQIEPWETTEIENRGEEVGNALADLLEIADGKDISKNSNAKKYLEENSKFTPADFLRFANAIKERAKVEGITIISVKTPTVEKKEVERDPLDLFNPYIAHALRRSEKEIQPNGKDKKIPVSVQKRFDRLYKVFDYQIKSFQGKDGITYSADEIIALIDGVRKTFGESQPKVRGAQAASPLAKISELLFSSVGKLLDSDSQVNKKLSKEEVKREVRRQLELMGIDQEKKLARDRANWENERPQKKVTEKELLLRAKLRNLDYTEAQIEIEVAKADPTRLKELGRVDKALQDVIRSMALGKEVPSPRIQELVELMGLEREEGEKQIRMMLEFQEFRLRELAEKKAGGEGFGKAWKMTKGTVKSFMWGGAAVGAGMTGGALLTGVLAAKVFNSFKLSAQREEEITEMESRIRLRLSDNKSEAFKAIYEVMTVQLADLKSAQIDKSSQRGREIDELRQVIAGGNEDVMTQYFVLVEEQASNIQYTAEADLEILEPDLDVHARETKAKVAAALYVLDQNTKLRKDKLEVRQVGLAENVLGSEYFQKKRGETWSGKLLKKIPGSAALYDKKMEDTWVGEAVKRLLPSKGSYGSFLDSLVYVGLFSQTAGMFGVILKGYFGAKLGYGITKGLVGERLVRKKFEQKDIENRGKDYGWAKAMISNDEFKNLHFKEWKEMKKLVDDYELAMVRSVGGVIEDISSDLLGDTRNLISRGIQGRSEGKKLTKIISAAGGAAGAVLSPSIFKGVVSAIGSPIAKGLESTFGKGATESFMKNLQEIAEEFNKKLKNIVPEFFTTDAEASEPKTSAGTSDHAATVEAVPEPSSESVEMKHLFDKAPGSIEFIADESTREWMVKHDFIITEDGGWQKDEIRGYASPLAYQIEMVYGKGGVQPRILKVEFNIVDGNLKENMYFDNGDHYLVNISEDGSEIGAKQIVESVAAAAPESVKLTPENYFNLVSQLKPGVEIVSDNQTTQWMIDHGFELDDDGDILIPNGNGHIYFLWGTKVEFKVDGDILHVNRLYENGELTVRQLDKDGNYLQPEPEPVKPAPAKAEPPKMKVEPPPKIYRVEPVAPAPGPAAPAVEVAQAESGEIRNFAEGVSPLGVDENAPNEPQVFELDGVKVIYDPQAHTKLIGDRYLIEYDDENKLSNFEDTKATKNINYETYLQDGYKGLKVPSGSDKAMVKELIKTMLQSAYGHVNGLDAFGSVDGLGEESRFVKDQLAMIIKEIQKFGVKVDIEIMMNGDLASEIEYRLKKE